MNKTVFFVILLFAVVTLSAQDITGSWGGSLEVQNRALRLVFHIERNDTILTTKMDSPDQGAFGLPTTRTTFKENRVEIVATGLGLYYNGTLENDTLKGTFNQGGIPFPLLLMRTEGPQFSRPQTPLAPLPYISEAITIIPDKKESLSLAGTLTLPDRAGVFPAVVLIAGSGPNDRDETLFGHKPFLVISDYLTRNGFAVLRYDKRGVGASTGDYSKATIQHFAEDVHAAVEYLKQRKEIAGSHIGLLGHSEGGIIAPMVAAIDKEIDFIVMMAGPGTNGIEVVMDQNDNSMRQQGMEPETIKMIQKINREMFESLLEWDGSENDRTALRDKLSFLWEQLPLLI
ncbi:MAG: alpha/beta fold hydrolase, partial [Proteiniphilum sp.]|nr:alpha/beta fold hydrolase [Proteiniphilum sp.]